MHAHRDLRQFRVTRHSEFWSIEDEELRPGTDFDELLDLTPLYSPGPPQGKTSEPNFANSTARDFERSSTAAQGPPGAPRMSHASLPSPNSRNL